MPDTGSPPPEHSLFRAVSAALFLLFVILGLCNTGGYGASWDDPHNQEFGTRMLRLLTEQKLSGATQHDLIHGPLLEMAIEGLSSMLAIENFRDRLLVRHFAVFLFFSATLCAFWKLTGYYLSEYSSRLAACGMLVFCPAIFAHSSYNSVDIGALGAMIFSMLGVFRFRERPDIRRTAMLGVLLGLCLNIRVTSLTAAGIGAVILCCDLFMRNPLAKKAAALYLVASALAVSVMIATNPIYWADTGDRLLQTVRSTIQFNAQFTVRFMGAEVKAGDPRFFLYNFVYMGITIPTSFLAMFFIGLLERAGLSLRALRTRGANPALELNQSLSLVLWLFVPIVTSMAFKTTLYNSWRHHFFTYPAFVLLAASGFRTLFVAIPFPWQAWRVAAACAALLNCLTVAGFLIRNPLHGSEYFNELVGGIRGAAPNFELDYWGLSFREALETLAARDRRSKILLFVSSPPGRANWRMLPPPDRARFEISEAKDADYILTRAIGPSGEIVAPKDGRAIVYEVMVDGVPVLKVFGAKTAGHPGFSVISGPRNATLAP